MVVTHGVHRSSSVIRISPDLGEGIRYPPTTLDQQGDGNALIGTADTTDCVDPTERTIIREFRPASSAG